MPQIASTDSKGNLVTVLEREREGRPKRFLEREKISLRGGGGGSEAHNGGWAERWAAPINSGRVRVTFKDVKSIIELGFGDSF